MLRAAFGDAMGDAGASSEMLEYSLVREADRLADGLRLLFCSHPTGCFACRLLRWYFRLRMQLCQHLISTFHWIFQMPAETDPRFTPQLTMGSAFGLGWIEHVKIGLVVLMNSMRFESRYPDFMKLQGNQIFALSFCSGTCVNSFSCCIADLRLSNTSSSMSR
jgi:hypothetical protein